MFEILNKEILGPVIKKIEIIAMHIAKTALPGQFVILRIDEKGERIPLTIAEKNEEKGTITLIFQEAGKTTKYLGTLKVGDRILDLAGPLGRPTEIENFGTVVCIGGGVGTAVMYPITKALKEKGNFVISIVGARTKNLLILEHEIKAVSDEIYITTDDGSYGEHGLVSNVLQRLIDSKRKIDRVYAIGPLPMMKVISNQTKPYNLKTIVSLDSVMVDGTGMCGSCRVTISNKTKFACVDGPEFNGHLVDWDELKARKLLFYESEQTSLKKFQDEMEGGQCQMK